MQEYSSTTSLLPTKGVLGESLLSASYAYSFIEFIIFGIMMNIIIK